MSIKLPLVPTEQIELLNKLAMSDTQEAQGLFIRLILSRDFKTEIPILNDDKVRQFENLLYGLETVGEDLLQRSKAGAFDSARSEIWRKLLWPAYRIRRTISLAKEIQNPDDALLLESINGILANRHPELRLHLKWIDLKTPTDSIIIWDEYLWSEIRRAFLLITRKDGGFTDIELAANIIFDLKKKQENREQELIVNFDKENIPEHEARLKTHLAFLRAVGLYNLARVVEITTHFIMNEPIRTVRGRQFAVAGVKGEIDRFLFSAKEAFSLSDRYLPFFAMRIGTACKSLIDSSIFSQTLPARVKDLLLNLADKASDKPILELWHAQQEAINTRLLDPTRTAVVLSLPTSSGKTLLAEMVIIQAWTDMPDSRIVYLAPTRALVTQISLTLKRDLGKQGMSVRVATPVFELNPVEREILQGNYNILVTTPEKIDLLIKEEHPSVEKISLVVVDEAHNLSDKERGAKLEFVLATLRREYPGTRFLLMTPFASNAKDIARWLGDESGQAILIDWKPNDRILAAVGTGQKKEKSQLQLHTLETVHSDCPAGIKIHIGDVQKGITSKEQITLTTVEKLVELEKRGIFVLASSRKIAEERAKEVANKIDKVSDSPAVDMVIRFLETEAGGKHPLADLLKKRVAFHHAGLSSEARYFIERLTEEGEILVICATTTLAQGVHFPLSIAIIETVHRTFPKKGNWIHEDMSPQEFWNIVGRVGRTLQDPLGIIMFPSTGKKDIEKWEKYLDKDSGIVTSALIKALQAIKEYKDIYFTLTLIENQMALSAFLQYILHALSLSSVKDVLQDLEGVLRSSFVYSEVKKESSELADFLIKFTRNYLDYLKEKKGNTLDAFAKLADGTGFSSPSVDEIWKDWFGKGMISDWQEINLFPEDGSLSNTLVESLRTLSRIPEIKIGTYEEGPFSAERVARITIKWVNGVSLSQIAKNEYEDDLLKCTQHIYSVITNLIPWGLRAVQKLAFAGKKEINWDSLDILPAMIFHGVRSKEAIALRMLNVPRGFAEGLAKEWKKNTEKIDFLKAEEWLSTTTSDQWERSLPKGSKIKGKEAKKMWEILNGRIEWKEVFRK
ncbi:MAG: DEAD/DEAH box helicase [bacterium]